MNRANMLSHANLVDLTMDLLLCSQARKNRWKSTRYKPVAMGGQCPPKWFKLEKLTNFANARFQSV